MMQIFFHPNKPRLTDYIDKLLHFLKYYLDQGERGVVSQDII